VVRRIGTGFEWWEDGGITGVVCVVVVVFSLSLFPSTSPFPFPHVSPPLPLTLSLSLSSVVYLASTFILCKQSNRHSFDLGILRGKGEDRPLLPSPLLVSAPALCYSTRRTPLVSSDALLSSATDSMSGQHSTSAGAGKTSEGGTTPVVREKAKRGARAVRRLSLLSLSCPARLVVCLLPKRGGSRRMEPLLFRCDEKG
jgi:hypothetical protein